MKKTWWKEAVVYQIYPRSFNDSNGDGIGDLNGITEKLEYLKLLGIDVIWLSPVYKSPNADNGYDISDYQDIMTEFGTMADFDAMLAKAHSLGLRIVMDLVVNHTSDEHAWFVESRKGKENPYRDYYIWRDPVDGHEPNNWGSCFSGSAWTLDETSGQYYLHCFAEKQPDLNWENPKVRDGVFDMMTWWCEKGIDGFRMDVISMISKFDGMPDGPTNGGLHGAPQTINGPRVHAYLQEMNHRVLSKYDLLTVGECPGATIESAKLYTGEHRDELNMVFQFDVVEGSTAKTPIGKWSTERPKISTIKQIFAHWENGLDDGWNSLFWDNHDQPRVISRFGNDSPEWRDKCAKMLGTCLHMMQGTPYIYQGEELGMTNYPFTDISQFRDIENLNAWKELLDAKLTTPEYLMDCFRYLSRDNARTPMQWNTEKNAGFSDAEPWIAVNPNYTEINAEAEVSDPDSVFNYYKKLIALRKAHDIIVYGGFELLDPEDDNLFAYVRTMDGAKLLCACNFTDAVQPFTAPDGFDGAKVLITNETAHQNGTLQPYEAIVLYQA